MDGRPLLAAVPPVDSAGQEDALGTALPMKSPGNEESSGTAAEMAPGTALPTESEDKKKTHPTIKNGDGGATSNTGKDATKNRDGGATTSKNLKTGQREAQEYGEDGEKSPPAGAQSNPVEEAGPRDWRREELAALLARAVQFSESLSQGSSFFADPVQRLIQSVQSLADAANSKSRGLAASEVEAAAAALCWAATHGKVRVEAARMAKSLASEAMSVATKSGRRDPSRTEAFLFCISIPGSLALLPYLPDRIPEYLQFYVAGLFGVVFAAASGGVVLSLQGIDGRDVEIVSWLSVVSFTAFSLLVTVFVSCALASGSVAMMIGLAALVVIGQFVAWRR